jgi:hypothetical protein
MTLSDVDLAVRGDGARLAEWTDNQSVWVLAYGRARRQLWSGGCGPGSGWSTTCSDGSTDHTHPRGVAYPHHAVNPHIQEGA